MGKEIRYSFSVCSNPDTSLGIIREVLVFDKLKSRGECPIKGGSVP